MQDDGRDSEGDLILFIVTRIDVMILSSHYNSTPESTDSGIHSIVAKS